jgi:hypothetical protein
MLVAGGAMETLFPVRNPIPRGSSRAGRRHRHLLLTLCVRAIEYTPHTHTFEHFLRQMLTATRGADRRQPLPARATLREQMPRSALSALHRTTTVAGCGRTVLQRNGVNLSALQNDDTEMFRQIWNNAGC